jgi:hypothetical protein
MAICPEFGDNNRSVRITMFVCSDSVVARTTPTGVGVELQAEVNASDEVFSPCIGHDDEA